MRASLHFPFWATNGIVTKAETCLQVPFQTIHDSIGEASRGKR